MARRAASISRAVMRARLGGLQAVLAEGDADCRAARGRALRPLNCLRYLVRLGCIMALSLRPSPAQAAASGRLLRGWGCASALAPIGAGWSNTSPLKIQTFTPITP